MTQRAEQNREALVRNTTDEKQLDDATRVLAQRAQTEREHVRRFTATTEGRALYRWLILFCAPEEQPFQGEHTHLTAFNCGQLNVAKRLRALIEEHAPEQALQMWQESLRPEKR